MSVLFSSMLMQSHPLRPLPWVSDRPAGGGEFYLCPLNTRKRQTIHASMPNYYCIVCDLLLYRLQFTSVSFAGDAWIACQRRVDSMSATRGMFLWVSGRITRLLLELPPKNNIRNLNFEFNNFDFRIKLRTFATEYIRHRLYALPQHYAIRHCKQRKNLRYEASCKHECNAPHYATYYQHVTKRVLPTAKGSLAPSDGMQASLSRI